MRDPVIGDWNNGYDNVVVKNIDIMNDDGTPGDTIVATEWFAELCFAGHWRVNAAWLKDNPPPEPEPEDPPVDEPEEPDA